MLRAPDYIPQYQGRLKGVDARLSKKLSPILGDNAPDACQADSRSIMLAGEKLAIFTQK